MYLRKHTLFLLTLALITMGTASAATIITPGNIPPLGELVQFNDPEAILSGMTVTGATNQSLTLVDFVGQEMLVAPANGQSWVDSEDGQFQDLLIRLHNGGSFGWLILNIDAAQNGLVRFILNGSEIFDNYELSKNGQNFFTIRPGPEGLSSVQIQTTVEMERVRQVRIGPAVAAVPEPSSFLLMGAGLTAVSFLIRKRRT